MTGAEGDGEMIVSAVPTFAKGRLALSRHPRQREYARRRYQHSKKYRSYRLSANRLARRHNETVVQRGKDSAARPRIEIALHRRVGWKVLGQTAAIGNRWTQCRGSHSSPFACLLRANARELKLLAEAAPSQTTRHPSYRFHIASHNVDE